jgi:hypothetical protein
VSPEDWSSGVLFLSAGCVLRFGGARVASENAARNRTKTRKQLLPVTASVFDVPFGAERLGVATGAVVSSAASAVFHVLPESNYSIDNKPYIPQLKPVSQRHTSANAQPLIKKHSLSSMR